jgi:hypothetical protein
VRRSSVLTVLVLFAAAPLAAQQNPSPDHPDHQAGAPPTSVAPQTTGWSIAVDGVLFATLDKQGGRRGETQFRSQNWLMAAGSHQLGPGSFSATAMVSAEPLTAYGKGYAQIFQVGEAMKACRSPITSTLMTSSCSCRRPGAFHLAIEPD